MQIKSLVQAGTTPGKSVYLGDADFLQQIDGSFICNIKGKDFGKIFALNKHGKLELKKDEK